MPCYLPVMQLPTAARLARRLYRAYATRASDQAEGTGAQSRQLGLMREILALRHEEAQLLGYANFGEVSVVPKMADRPHRSSPSCAIWPSGPGLRPNKTWHDLRAFAARTPGPGQTPSPGTGRMWQKSSKKRATPSASRSCANTSPAPKVLAGLFKIIETLFEVAIRRDQRPSVAPGGGVLTASSATASW